MGARPWLLHEEVLLAFLHVESFLAMLAKEKGGEIGRRLNFSIQ